MYKLTSQDISPYLVRMQSYASMKDPQNGEDICQDAIETLLRYPIKEPPRGIGLFFTSIKFALAKHHRKENSARRGGKVEKINYEDILETNREPYENSRAENIIEIKEYLKNLKNLKKPKKPKSKPVKPKPVKPDRVAQLAAQYTRQCLNCGAPIPSSIPFCSDKCRRIHAKL